VSEASLLPIRHVTFHDTDGPDATSGLPPAKAVGADTEDGATESGAYRVGSLVVTRLWSRPTPGGARLTAGYLRIANNGSEPDRLIGGSALIAERFEIHASDVNDGVARMRALREGIDIPAGETIELRPGGKHLMFAQLKNSVSQGEKFEATLVFEKAGPLAVAFEVRIHADPDELEIER
jgi:copper(I)-binding protein